MKVVVWGINYAPEVTGIAPYNVALCRHLRERGHDVRMVTTFSYYPTWKKLPEDRGRLYRTDQIDGVPVHRCWHFVPAKPSAIKRILHEASFIATSWCRLLLLPRADVYVVVSPPLLLGFAAWILTGIKRAPFVFHVQDLQPDAAVGLGMLKPSLLTKALYWLEAFAYRKAAMVSGICEGMVRAFESKGVPSSKRYLFFNGVDVAADSATAQAGVFRSAHGLGPDVFVAVYSGNLGVKQGLGILLDAAALVTKNSVRIVICGDGAERTQLEATAKVRGLGNVIFLPLQPKQQYQNMLADADVSLITQQSGTGQFFFPSKLLSNLSAGKAVVTVADPDSELALAQIAGSFGFNVPPGQPDKLASLLDSLADRRSHLPALGENGRSYVSRFAFSNVLADFETQLKRLVKI